MTDDVAGSKKRRARTGTRPTAGGGGSDDARRAGPLSVPGLEVKSVGDTLVLRRHRAPRGALVLGALGLLLAAPGVVYRYWNGPESGWLPLAFFLTPAAVVWGPAVVLLVETEAAFDRAARRVVRTRRLFGLAWSARRELAGDEVVWSETVVTTRPGEDGDTVTESHAVRLSRRPAGGAVPTGGGDAFTVFAADSAGQARAAARLAAGFLGLSWEDRGVRHVDRTA